MPTRVLFRVSAGLAALASSGYAQQQIAQVRGVNLGGWLVLESWMYPNFYSQYGIPGDIGEGPFIAALRGKGVDPVPVMQGFWDGWLQYSDLQAVAAAGMTHVRIPIGYWILGEEFMRAGDPPYIAGRGWDYLLRGLTWCRELGLKAIVGLHAAPGSQNGLEHSGIKGPIGWDKGDNVARSVEVLRSLAGRLMAVNAQPETAGVVQGIGLLNEPWTYFVGGPIDPQVHKDFVQAATDAVRGAGWTGPELQVWYSDGWNVTWGGWANFLPPASGYTMVMDRHVYVSGPGEAGVAVTGFV